MKRDGINTDGMSAQDKEKLERIRRNCLHMYNQSIGWMFRVKGTPLVDEVTGVDWDLQMVKGKLYGNFHVDLCELTPEKASTVN